MNRFDQLGNPPVLESQEIKDMSSSPIRIAVIIVFVAVAFFAKGTWIEAAGSETPPEITARVGLSGRPWINLKDGYEAKTSFAGNGLDAFADLRPV